MRDLSFLKDFCMVFYEITSCPIYLYDGQTRVLSLPEDPFSFVLHHQEALWKQQNVCYSISETGLFFARIPVEETDFSVVMGPFLMNYLSEELVRRVMDEYRMNAYSPEIIMDYLHSVPSGIFSQAASLVRAICFAVTGSLPEIGNLFPNVSRNLNSHISRDHMKSLIQTREEENYHNSYHFEQVVFSRIQQGDVDFFRGWNQASRYRVGKMAETTLRQAKNTFIVTVTLVTRAAVSGGLEEEIAYQLSDEYIQAVERMVNLDSVEHLSRSMLIDFVERVRNAALPLWDIPEDISRSIRYIRQHTNSNLSVQEVADAVNLSRSHLSRKFKDVMGFEIGAFIMRCKLEEAKELLSYSEQSIAEISNYLCFSSQSYFTSVFRKKFGQTPKEYRQQHQKDH